MVWNTNMVTSMGSFGRPVFQEERNSVDREGRPDHRLPTWSQFNYWNTTMTAVMSSENALYLIVSFKFSVSKKNSKFLESGSLHSLTFFRLQVIFQFLLAAISLAVSYEEMKLALIAPVNKLFKLLILICKRTYGDAFYRLTCMLWISDQ